MKKTNTWSLLALCCCLFGAMTLTTACGGDDDDNGGTAPTTSPTTPGTATASDLVGTWSQNGATYVFTNSTLTINVDGRETFRGAYTYAGGKLTYTTESDGQPYTTTAEVKLLYNKSVLVLKTVPDWAENYSLADVAEVLYKDGRAPVTPVADIQGTWYWYMQGDRSYIRTGLTITGNRFELIITPWAERHVGTFTYEGGVLHLTPTASYTARGENGQGFGEGLLDPATLECSHWYDWGSFNIDPDMPFIASDDGEAYGTVANLPAVFIKQ